jgi:hypothetical protein
MTWQPNAGASASRKVLAEPSEVFYAVRPLLPGNILRLNLRLSISILTRPPFDFLGAEQEAFTS